MQADLFAHAPRFDGPNVSPADHRRLSGHLGKVKACLADGCWWTLAELAQAIHGSEAGASARLRDLRKLKFGGYTVERRRIHARSGAYEYRLRPETR